LCDCVEERSAHSFDSLNVAIGANGTGKSTILNAICLGLGGEPKILGREDDSRSFIKHNEQEATITIELAPFPGKEQHTITRVLRSRDTEGAKSICFINGEKAKIRDVRRLVKTVYHISVDNLCTFLPQDKVGNFSGFSDAQRLLETEKTLRLDDGTGDEREGEMDDDDDDEQTGAFFYDQHMKLIKIEEDFLEASNSTKKLEERLKAVEHEKSQMERAKEKMEERQRAIEQKELLEKKLVWLRFEEQRERTLQAKEEKAKKKDELKAAHAQLQPLKDKADAATEATKGVTERLRQYEAESKKRQEQMEKQQAKVEKHDDAIESATADLQSMEARRSQRQAELDHILSQLKSYKEHFSSFPSKEDTQRDLDEAVAAKTVIQSKYDDAKRELKRLRQDANELKVDRDGVERKLGPLLDEGAVRRNHFFQENHDLKKVEQALEKRDFRRSVWGPVGCEINPKSHNAACYIETQVPRRILRAYIVETEDDYKKLVDLAKHVGVAASVVKVDRGKLKDIVRMYSQKKMKYLTRECGVDGYLDESFTCPDAVLQALRDHASVHKVIVGNDKTHKLASSGQLLTSLCEDDEGRRNNGATIYCSNGNRSERFTISKSRYSTTPVVQTSDIRQARLLSPGSNGSKKKELQDKLATIDQKIEELQPSIAEKEQNVEQLESDTQEASLKWQSCRKNQQNLLKCEEKVRRAERKRKDAEELLKSDDKGEKRDLLRQLQNAFMHNISAIEAHKDHRQSLINATVKSAGAHLGKAEAKFVERRTRYVVSLHTFGYRLTFLHRQEYDEKQHESRQIDQAYQNASTAFANARKLLNTLHQKANTEAPLEDDEKNILPLKHQLDELTVETVSDAEAAIEDAEQIISGIRENDGVLQQYQKMKQEYTALTNELNALTDGRENRRIALDNERQAWQTKLEVHLRAVNDRFAAYMQAMQYTGEVKLRHGEMNAKEGRYNFKDWGIQILVSYRENTKAQVLSAHQHSGGERSVATILYLMALQDVMVAPFRCVDEINQGLDERNERLVFSRIVENSTGPPRSSGPRHDHSGQYFLITPKLLPNMTAMENEGVTIHTVNNGKSHVLLVFAAF